MYILWTKERIVFDYNINNNEETSFQSHGLTPYNDSFIVHPHKIKAHAIYSFMTSPTSFKTSPIWSTDNWSYTGMTDCTGFLII